MRILQLGPAVFHEIPGNPETVHFSNSCANISLSDTNLTFSIIEKVGDVNEVFVHDGVIYHFEYSEGGDSDYLSLKEGRMRVVDSEGESLEMAPEMLYLLIRYFDDRSRYRHVNDARVLGVLLGYVINGKSQSVLCLAELGTGVYKVIPRRGIVNEYLLDDRVIAFHDRERQLICLDYDFQFIWSFKPKCFLPKYFRGPEVYQNITIQSFGPDRISKSPAEMRNGEPVADKIRHHDTTLYGVDIKDGHEIWHLVLPKTVDNMEIVSDRLYVSSMNEIHLLEPSSGGTLQVVNTGLSDDYDIASQHGSSLHIEGEYLYYCHSADACILVYRLHDLALERRIDIPEPYTVKGFEYCHKPSGRLYFELSARGGRIYEHMSPLLEVDPSDLQSEIEIYKGPPVEVELKPSEENPEEQEVWVTMRGVPLEEAMVFAEMHTQDQAYYHGNQGGAFVSLHQTKNFNGKVHFIYSGSDRPASEVRKMLDLLEERFAGWARYSAYSSIDPTQDVTLEAMYVE